MHAPAALLAASVLLACASEGSTNNAATAGAAGQTTSTAAGQAASGSGASGSAAPPAGAAGAAGAAAGTGKLSFANDIYPRVIRTRCGSCHNDMTSFGGLAFFPGGPETAFGNLVGAPAGSTDEKYKCRASGLTRVVPGDPEQSLMYLKITVPPCGTKMPPPAFAQVTQEQVDLVRQWIVEGAAP